MEGLNKNDSSFSYDVQRWTSSIFLQGLEYTVCSGTYLLGGYGIIGQAGIPATDIYLQRIYTDLSSTHTMIYFSFTLWALDSWNGNNGDSFQLEFDFRIMTGWMFNMLNFPMGNKVCGVSQARDLNNLRVFGRVYHKGTTLSFKLRSELDQWPTDESFGIRDLNLLFVESPTTTRENLCAIAPISLSSNQCICPEGQYEAIPGSGTCTNCDSRCKSCFGGDSKSCYECAPGTYFNGQACLICPEYCAICTGEAPNQCIICQPGYYMLVIQGICLKTCTSPMTTFFTGTIGYCQAPYCSSSNFLRWDGTCSPTCATPLLQSFIGTLKLCINPCSIGEYLYWDGSCRQSCVSPLQINAQTGVNYCDTNCAGYFYDDGTCSPTCIPPLVPKTHGIRLFCTYPCDGNQYLFGNSSCGDTCPPPWTARETNGLRYCDFNCLSTEYLAWNGSCISTCNPPLITDTQSVGKLCLPPCGSIDIYYYVSTGTCSEKCNMQAQLDRQDLYPKCLSVPPTDDEVTIVNPLITASTKPNGVTFVTLTRLLHPLRYLDVELPPRLQTLVSYPTRSPLCITPFIAIPERVKAHFSQQPIPTVYSERGVHSSFFVNFWQETISFFIVAAAVLTLGCLEKTSEKCGSNCLQVFFERLRVIFGCSYLFILFGSSAGDIVFFAFLELRAFNWTYVLGVFSFGMAVFILGMLGIFINKVLNVTAKIQKSKKDAFFKRSDGLYMSTLIQWQNYQIFFRGFKQHFKPNNYFYFIYLTRIISPMVIAAFLYRIPLLQTSLYVLINLLIIGYLVFAQPLRSTLNFIQLLLIETLTLIINIAILVLAASTNSSLTSVKKVFLGDLIILGNDVINATLGIFFILKFFFGMRNACRLKTIQSEMTQDAWYQLLFIPLQQGGLGFERARVARFPRIHVKHTDNKMDLLQEKEDEGVADNDSFIYYKEYADFEKDTTISSHNLKEEDLISQKKPRVKYLPGEEDEVEVFGITRKDENEEEDLTEAIEKATEALAISVIPGFKPRRKKHIDPEDDLSMPTYENELTVQPFDLNQSSFFPMSNTNQDYESYDQDNQLPTVEESKHFAYIPKAQLDEDEMRRKMSGINEVDEEEEKADSPQKSARSVKDNKEGTVVLGARLGDIDQELPEAPPLKNSETPKKIKETLNNEASQKIKEKLKNKTPKKSKETIKSETLKEILKDHETPKNITKKKKNETPKNLKVTNQPAPSRDDPEDEDDLAIIEKMILPQLPEKDEKMVEIEKQFLKKDDDVKIRKTHVSKKEEKDDVKVRNAIKETPIEMEILINPTKQKKEIIREDTMVRKIPKATTPPAADEMEIFTNYTKNNTEKESIVSTTRNVRKTAREIAAEVDTMISSKRDHTEVPKLKKDAVDIEKQFLESATPDVKVKKTAKEISAEMDILLGSTIEGKTQPQQKLKGYMPSVMESQKMSGQQSNRIADPDKDFEQTFLQANKNEMSKFFVSNKDSARTYDSNAFAPRKDKQKNPDDINIMNASFTSELADIFTKKK